MRSVRIFCAIQPTCRDDIPDHKTKISQAENGKTFIFDFGKFGDVVLHDEKRNEGKKDKKGNAVSWPGNTQHDG